MENCDFTLVFNNGEWQPCCKDWVIMLKKCFQKHKVIESKFYVLICHILLKSLLYLPSNIAVI